MSAPVKLPDRLRSLQQPVRRNNLDVFYEYVFILFGGIRVQHALRTVSPAERLPYRLWKLRRILLRPLRLKSNLKELFMKSIGLILFLFCLVGLAACSKEAFNAASSDNGTGVIAACSTGYVYTASYGCQPQSTCSSGYALYNGQCVSTTATPTPSLNATKTSGLSGRAFLHRFESIETGLDRFEHFPSGC